MGVMLWAAERGDGHGHGAGTAAGVRSRGGALPLCSQRRVLHLPPHQLRERWTAVQGLRTGLLCLQTQGDASGGRDEFGDENGFIQAAVMVVRGSKRDFSEFRGEVYNIKRPYRWVLHVLSY